MDDVGEFTEHFLELVKSKCISLSYGEFDGMKEPSLGDLYVLRGALEAAIHEKQSKED